MGAASWQDPDPDPGQDFGDPDGLDDVVLLPLPPAEFGDATISNDTDDTDDTDDGRDAATPAAGSPASSPGGGHGLIGMRERAQSAGGRLRVGPGPRGGFEVVTELPLPGR